MRSLLRGIAALVVTASAASAADLGVAPAPPPVPPSWTGLYIGVHAGAAWQNFTSGSIDDPNGLLASGSRTGGSALVRLVACRRGTIGSLRQPGLPVSKAIFLGRRCLINEEGPLRWARTVCRLAPAAR